MELYGSLTSPFVRACRIVAIELDLRDVKLVPTTVKPTEPNVGFGEAINPLRRVPAFDTGAGEVLIDSRVIVEWMNVYARGQIVPTDANARIGALNRLAVVSGATEALVLAMYEMNVRPEAKRWPEWTDDQIDKARSALDWVEARIGAYSQSFDIAAIGLVCLVGYAQFRFGKDDWLQGRPGLAAFMREASRRPSVSSTAPPK
jgi:glutathione S-transferase